MRGPRITLDVWSLAGAEQGGGAGLGRAGGHLGAWRGCGAGSQVPRRQDDIGVGSDRPKLAVQK